MKKTIAGLMAVIMVSSMLAVFAISPAYSGGTGGEVVTNYGPTIEYINDDGSTYRTYAGYSNDTIHRYIWEGDTIKLKVRVTDANGLDDIASIWLYIDDTNRTYARLTTETITNTSAYYTYTLTYTVPDKNMLYGNKSIKVRVIDLIGESNYTGTLGSNISNVWFNPVCTSTTSGSIDYAPGDPGDIVPANNTLVNSTWDCGSTIYGSDRKFVIDGTSKEHDESSDYNWTMRVRNAADGNVFMVLKVSGTDMTGTTYGKTILVTNQYFYMNSTRSSTMSTGLTSTAQNADSDFRPNEYNYFDFYLKYPAVPKDTYTGSVTFTWAIA